MGKGYPRDFEVPGNTVHLVVTTVEWEGGLDLLGQNTQHRQIRPHEETLFQNKIRKKKWQAGKCAEVRVRGGVGPAPARAGVCGTFQKEISTETPVSGCLPEAPRVCLRGQAAGIGRAEATGRGDLGSQRGRGKKRGQS